MSLLPDFAAARYGGTLGAIEQAVDEYEEQRLRGATAQQAAQEVRPDIEAQGALRWVRRRTRWFHAALMLVMGCAPEVLAQVELSVRNMRQILGTRQVLLRVREIAHQQLQHAPAPVGLAAVEHVRSDALQRVQHNVGPDPPTPAR